MPSLQQEQREAALRLADLFKESVESFGLIHQGVNTNRPQRILLAKLGVQQARLLAWGVQVGICELQDELRDIRLDPTDYRSKVEAGLQSIVDQSGKPSQPAQYEGYGLKSAKRTSAHLEPAIDYSRLEFIRNRYAHLGARRGRKVTSNHWLVQDNDKFKTFVSEIREHIDFLIRTMGNGDWIDRAVRSDIKVRDSDYLAIVSFP
jgi:hypothetical protein